MLSSAADECLGLIKGRVGGSLDGLSTLVEAIQAVS